MEQGRRRQRTRDRQESRDHKKETLRKASEGLVRIHFYVSHLWGDSEAISKGFERSELFPLDGAGGLGGHVVDDAVDAADLVDDARGGLGQDVPGLSLIHI